MTDDFSADAAALLRPDTVVYLSDMTAVVATLYPLKTVRVVHRTDTQYMPHHNLAVGGGGVAIVCRTPSPWLASRSYAKLLLPHAAADSCSDVHCGDECWCGLRVQFFDDSSRLRPVVYGSSVDFVPLASVSAMSPDGRYDWCVGVAGDPYVMLGGNRVATWPQVRCTEVLCCSYRRGVVAAGTDTGVLLRWDSRSGQKSAVCLPVGQTRYVAQGDDVDVVVGERGAASARAGDAMLLRASGTRLPVIGLAQSMMYVCTRTVQWWMLRTVLCGCYQRAGSPLSLLPVELVQRIASFVWEAEFTSVGCARVDGGGPVYRAQQLCVDNSGSLWVKRGDVAIGEAERPRPRGRRHEAGSRRLRWGRKARKVTGVGE